ncbi:Guanine nucleotide-binding protein G(s) subunit alpha [Camponotus floridanus]|uniref:Guanine nucleotide-binding protein G(S) subunit alpha n=1 Tax=Camponotus floridanus TaxID=104421 RepID=E2ARV6_CAMFO|nr:Guanine nucleotide-binding protein G(s) subunit alpha [Camponotus floridanus]
MGCFGSQSSKASQDDSKNQKRRSDAITRQLQKDKQVYRATHRLLLLGAGESGKSTIVKDEDITRQWFQRSTITTAMSTLTPPVTLEDPANQSRMDYVLEVSSSPDFDYPPIQLENTNQILIVKSIKRSSYKKIESYHDN